jgi:uncharacterized NAD-dependent epimerase/dehydratase family protein
MLVSGNAKSVILVHAPKRMYYDHDPVWGRIPSVESEISLIHQFGSKVIAVALNTENCTGEEADAFQSSYELKLQIPVMLPLQAGCNKIIPVMQQLIASKKQISQ